MTGDKPNDKYELKESLQNHHHRLIKLDVRLNHVSITQFHDFHNV